MNEMMSQMSQDPRQVIMELVDELIEKYMDTKVKMVAVANDLEKETGKQAEDENTSDMLKGCIEYTDEIREGIFSVLQMLQPAMPQQAMGHPGMMSPDMEEDEMDEEDEDIYDEEESYYNGGRYYNVGNFQPRYYR